MCSCLRRAHKSLLSPTCSSCLCGHSGRKARFQSARCALGGSEYVTKALEETAQKVAQFCENVTALEHPQMGFILLRQCCGTCRVVHLLRALQTDKTSELAEAVNKHDGFGARHAQGSMSGSCSNSNDSAAETCGLWADKSEQHRAIGIFYRKMDLPRQRQPTCPFPSHVLCGHQ